MISLKSAQTRFNLLKLWQKIIVVLLGLYVAKYLYKILKIASTFHTLTKVSDVLGINTENFEGTDSKILKCTMYYTTWCGYCKKAKPEWEQLTNEFNNNNINGTKIIITKIDGDADPQIIKQESINGYPTFKFELDGTHLDYNGGRIYSDFKHYIEQIVNTSE